MSPPLTVFLYKTTYFFKNNQYFSCCKKISNNWEFSQISKAIKRIKVNIFFAKYKNKALRKFCRKKKLKKNLKQKIHRLIKGENKKKNSFIVVRKFFK